MRHVLATMMTVCVLAGAARAANAPKRSELGRTVKLRILVDKVMQPTAGWKTEEWMVKAAADAGFNVFSPRVGYDDLEAVRRVTQWCEKYGIYHMPWMRGSLAAPMDASAAGRRLVWANGGEQPLWSPNSDEFWKWTTRYIVEYAKLSARRPHLMGVFLDYENYAKGRQRNCYSLSYDDLILNAFAKAKGIALPKLALNERKPWLDKQGLHDAFEQFQIAWWRGRCRALREAVDRYDPTFQFCIYPAPGTPFMVKAIYPEWATKAAPLILADACTYGRPSRFLPEQEALRINKERLLKRMEIPKHAGIPFIYAGGIDPVVRGADPEFCGKNAVAICEVTDGYWIFYEGPKYKTTHPAYWKWFTWANRAIARGDFAAQHQPRQTPESWAVELFKRGPEAGGLKPLRADAKAAAFPVVKLRGDNMIVLAAQAGRLVRVVLQHQPVASYRSELVWELRDPGLKQIAKGRIPFKAQGVIEFTPKKDGLYLLGATASSCAYSLVRSNVPAGLYCADGVHLIYGAKRLYFYVPAGVRAFKVLARGYQGETVRVNVFDPKGEQVAAGETTSSQQKIAVVVKTDGRAPGVWALEVARASKGVLEDNRISLDPKLPPVLSLAPEHVFGSPR